MSCILTEVIIDIIKKAKRIGAGGGNRTRTEQAPGDFESPAYTNFTTPARKEVIIKKRRLEVKQNNAVLGKP